MKVFEGGNGIWRGRTNFVDSNNVLLGYENSLQCCESFGWYYSEKKGASEGREDVEGLEDYCFDPSYVVDTEFRLTATGKPDLYLTLHNEHNGYYSHGFALRKGDTVLHEGSI